MGIKVSVIIPVYNREKYLSKCLESILNQTLREIEIIAIDDGSTDSSLKILKQYADKYQNIIVLTQENQGAGASRNRGIRQARGKYLIFIDSDDFYPVKDCLELLYNTAEKHHVSVCGGIMIILEDHVDMQKKYIYDEKITKKFYCNKIIKTQEYPDIYGYTRYLFLTDLIRDNNIYFPSYRRFQDPPFAVKALVYAKEFYGLDKIVYEYRIGHKRIDFSLEACLDVLRGIRDVFQLVKKNNLRKMYDEKLKNIFVQNMSLIYKYSFCGNQVIDGIIDEINEIAKSWIGGELGPILTEKTVKETRQNCLKERENIVKVLNSNRPKIIYGAGVIAYNFLELYKDKIRNVIGIAVSKAQIDFPDQLFGYRIKLIEEYLPYREGVQIMVATTSKYWTEIEENLEKLGFDHIIELDWKKIELAEALLEE